MGALNIRGGAGLHREATKLVQGAALRLQPAMSLIGRNVARYNIKVMNQVFLYKAALINVASGAIKIIRQVFKRRSGLNAL